MKYITFLLLATLFTSCFSTRKIPTQRHTVTGIISVDKKADKIYDNVEMWFAKTYTDSRAVLECNNRDSKQLYGNCRTMIALKHDSHWSYTLEIQIKDNKLKYTFSNFINDGYGKNKEIYEYYEYEDSSFYGRFWPEIKTKLDEHIKSSAKDMENYIKNTDDNW